MSALPSQLSDRRPSSLMKRARFVTVFVLVVCVVSASASAQETKRVAFSKRAPTALRLMAVMFTKLHPNKPVFDERFCERWVDKYLEKLDPAKHYFLADDISEFETYIKKLPESTETGDLKFFKLVSERYQVRIQSALDDALKRMDGEFDFSIDESITLDHEDWPKSQGDRTERWRLQLKYDLLVESTRFKNRGDQIAFLKARYEAILKQAKGLTEEEAIGLYLNSFCCAVGPHCEYITPQKYGSFVGSSLLTPYSMGLVLSVDTQGRVVIVNTRPGFRGEPATPKVAGCELLAITSNNGDVHHCHEIELFTVCNLMRYGLGKETSVKLELHDRENERRFAVTWPRKIVER